MNTGLTHKTGPLVAILTFLLFLSQTFGQEAPLLSTAAHDLKRLSIEELMQQEVTSVSRRTQTVEQAAAAIDVITAEDIRRSGATSIPDALRLATGVHVAQSSGNTWAISARGFNASASTANKMQVLMDGRILYNPLFSGVFWDVQNYLLEDIDRIEVIRGPGATLWGGNAVNGVINIVTKSSAQTQGTLITGGYGNEVQGFGGVRYGGKLSENSTYRVYLDYFNRDGLALPSGADAPDDFTLGQTGFRTDTRLNDVNALVVQGDYYDGAFGTLTPRDSRVSGANLLSRWTRTFSSESDLNVQLYYDHTYRSLPTFVEDLNTLELDAQHRFPVGERNDLMWGFQYRLMMDRIANPVAPAVQVIPANRDMQLASAFVQDEISLIPDKLELTLGSKFEHNDFSGFEVQPSTHLAWQPSSSQTLWAGISRAVRTPSRLETDVASLAPTPTGTIGILNQPRDQFRAEDLIAYELGYRLSVSERWSFDVATFYDRYNHVRSIEPVTAPGAQDVRVVLGNEVEGEAYGFEIAQRVRITDFWLIRASYTRLNEHLRLAPGSRAREVVPGPNEGTASEVNDPENMFRLLSILNLPHNIEFDQVLRYADSLPNPHIPSFLALDLRLAWHPCPNLEIALAGQNLLDDRHPEFVLTREVERSIYGKVTWTF